MVFISFEFVLLIALTFVIYYVASYRYQKYVLLLASTVFIGYNSLYFLLTAVLLSTATYWLGLRLSKKQEEKTLNRIYFSGIAFLVGVWTVCRHSGLIIPLGISFYTFQALSYLTEVYWGEFKAEKNYLNFLLYMLLFMKFLSGPIERPSALLPQLQEGKKFDYDTITYGLKLILLGLIKKLVIADNLSSAIDAIYASPQDASGIQLFMTMLIYPIQLYTDFSGYTDMALGTARLFGYRLTPNFDRPFTAETTSDLWRRWHITLSFWVRDYIFMPLTSVLRRWNKPGIYLSLLITFSALGVWHGVGMSFVVYCLIQGIIICYEMRFGFLRNFILKKLGARIGGWVLILRTYLLFAFSLIFFRAGNIREAIYFISRMSFRVNQSWKEINIGLTDHVCIVAGSALLLIWIFEYFQSKRDLFQVISRQPVWIRWSVYYILIFALLTTGKFDSENFIYLQF